MALPPPVHYLYGLTPSAVGPGTSTFTMPASRWLLPPQGVISGAAMALLVDGPLGTAVQTALPPATPYTTAEISLTFIRPVEADGSLLTATGRLVSAGRSIGLSEANVTNAMGDLVAVTSTRCVIMPAVDVPPGTSQDLAADPPHPVEPAWESPHPFEREVAGEVLPQETWDRLDGLEILNGLIAGDLPAPPISRLLGVWPESASEGESTWSMPATGWMCSPVQGRLYGGLTAYLAGNAIDGAIWTTTGPGVAFAPLDLKVYFLRAVAPTGGDLKAIGRVTHRGRTMAIATSEVFDADGKRVAIATGSAMILPGRPVAFARTSRNSPG